MLIGGEQTLEHQIRIRLTRFQPTEREHPTERPCLLFFDILVESSGDEFSSGIARSEELNSARVDPYVDFAKRFRLWLVESCQGADV